jgi:hypothetical protein
MVGVMKYAHEMGSVSMVYMLGFIKIGSGIEKVIWGYTDTPDEDCISLF